MSSNWMLESGKYFGFTENTHTTQIKSWADTMGPESFAKTFDPSDNKSSWAGVYVAQCLKGAGFPIIKEYWKNEEWMFYGDGLSVPLESCIGIFAGNSGRYHVGFILGKNVDGKYVVRGGNQFNKVCDALIASRRLVSSRWPKGISRPDRFLPTVPTPPGGYSISEI